MRVRDRRVRRGLGTSPRSSRSSRRRRRRRVARRAMCRAARCETSTSLCLSYPRVRTHPDISAARALSCAFETPRDLCLMRAAIDKSRPRSRRDVARASSTSAHARARRRDADALDERRANGRRPAPRRETTRASDASDATRSIDHRAAIERNERTRDARGANARARGRGRRC